MKRVLIISISFFTSLFSYAQQDGYQYVDNKIVSIPETLTGTTASIASFVQAKFKTEKEKFRAIHRWVTYNIKYDTDSMYVFNWGADPSKKVTAALRRRKGVCENFTAVFNEIAKKCNLQSYIVSGYTKQSGRIDNVGHTWCAVNVNAEWLFCDPTWDENYKTDPAYFLIRPIDFIDSHMPFDPLWQMLDQPVSKDAFYRGNLYSLKDTRGYPFADSIKAYLQLNELHQLESAINRIKHYALVNDLEINNLLFLEMQAGIIYEDRDMNLYNSAIVDMNNATGIFNEYIEYRNRQFIPEKSDQEMSVILAAPAIKLNAAEKKLELLERSTTNAQYNTQTAFERLKNLRTKLREQQDFLNRYLSSSVSERKRLFYN